MKKASSSKVLLFSVLLLQACASTKPTVESLPALKEPSTQLRVSLFPYLPDTADDKFKSMKERIEKEFEKDNPGIDLVLRPMDDASNPYDVAAIKQRFSEGDANASDVIELDTVMLGEVVKANLIQEIAQDEESRDWLPPAAKAARYNGKLYGLPHWLCGHFIISRMPGVKNVRSASELTRLLDSGAPDVPNLAGNLLGSWNLPCLYLDAWADSHGPAGLSSAVSTNLDAAVVKSLNLVASEETFNGVNPGLDGTYENKPDLDAEDFAKGKTEALLGYSERLNVVLKNRTDTAPLYIASACLGEGDHALAFADVFVVRRASSAKVATAAAKFARYMTLPSTYAWIHQSEDAPAGKRIPRYLSPATRNAYRATGMRQDPLMQQVFEVMKTADIFPQSGLLDTRKAMRDAILNSIHKP